MAKRPTIGIATRGLPAAQDVIVYNALYRCKHCGKEWTKTSEEDVKLPRTYVADEYGAEDEGSVQEEEDKEEYGPDSDED